MSLDATSHLRDALYKEDEEEVDELRFLPYTSVEPLLEKHPLMAYMKVSKTEVHKCLTHMLTHRLASHEARTTVKAHEVRNTCVECKAPIMLDSRNGTWICSSCGIQQRGPVYGEQIFTALSQADLNRLDHGECDVPEWLLAQNAHGENWTRYQLESEVEHWNAYMHLPVDELAAVKQIAGWMKRRASNESRVAAAFLFRYMETRIDMETLNGTDFPIVYWYHSDTGGEQCPHCKEILPSKYQTSRHVCVNNMRKKHRRQFSLVRNKACKVKLA